jgi:PE family
VDALHGVVLPLAAMFAREAEMTLRVLPEGLAAAGAAVETLTARLAAAHAAAAPLITAVLPPAADPVSLETATGFSAAGSRHAAASY